MNKAVISNRIYLKPETPEQRAEIIKQLTYKIEVKGNPNNKNKTVEIIKNYKVFTGGILSLPQGRLDLIPPDFEIVDKRVSYPAPLPPARIPLRPQQLEVYDQVEGSCFINALVGWGKTFTALHIAKKLGQRTLIVTHTTMLRDQWIEEVETLYGIKCGIIGSGKLDIEDCAIVVGNVQTVTKMIVKLQKEFGLIILDEAHHVPADTFSKLVDNMYSLYRIALSGTINRTDGKHVLFKDYFGAKMFQPPQSHTLLPKVRMIKTGLHLPFNLAYVKKINELLYNDDYQYLIADIAKRYIDKGYKVLIPASRVEFLEKIAEILGKDAVLITGAVDFDTRKELIARLENDQAHAILGSKQIFAEGISVNCLSLIILPEPSANLITLEQLIGRIMRKDDDKLEPLVIDITFSSKAERAQAATRRGFYIGKGWEVEEV